MTAPALEPVEVRILDDLQGTLTQISPTHPTVPFYTNVKAVRLMDQDPSNVDALPLPCIVVAHLGTSHRWAGMTGAQCENIAGLAVFCFVPRNTNWRRDLIRFVSDVRRAFQVDHQRGLQDDQPNAFDTSVDNSEISNLVDGNNVAMARLDVSITYRDSFLDPTQSG